MEAMTNNAQGVHNMAAQVNNDVPQALPVVGLSRWQQIADFVAVSRETWRQLVKAGKAPKPIKLGKGTTLYKNEEVHKWMANPCEYQA